MFQMESDFGNLPIALLKERKIYYYYCIYNISYIYIIAIFYVSDGVRLRELSYSIVEEEKGNIYYYYCIYNISYIYMIAIFYFSDGVRFREHSYSIVEGEKGQIKLSQLYYCATPLSVVLYTTDGTAYGKFDYVILY